MPGTNEVHDFTDERVGARLDHCSFCELQATTFQVDRLTRARTVSWMCVWLFVLQQTFDAYTG